MNDVPQCQLDAFISACRDAAARGLMRCSSGNLSRRLDDARLLATATRSWAQNLSVADVAVCRIADGAALDGPRPTVEIGFHAGIMRTRPDIHVVMHFQTPCATTMACRRQDNTDYFVIPEIPFYIGPVARIPYFRPGSQALADAVTQAMQNNDLVIMSNHGLVTAAVDYAHAIQNAEFFELACEIVVRGDKPPERLPQTEIDHLLDLRRGVDGSRNV